MSAITSIVYRPQSIPAHPNDHFSRLPLQRTRLIEKYGIEGDCKGGHPERQLNIMSQESLNALSGEGFLTEPGQLGEQLIIDGLGATLNSLDEGTQLRIGAEAIVEVTSLRTGCERFEAIQGKAPSKAAGRLGLMAKVVQGGAIAVGDSVEILS
jgi:MOSC domain-containing protein YiiM